MADIANLKISKHDLLVLQHLQIATTPRKIQMLGWMLRTAQSKVKTSTTPPSILTVHHEVRNRSEGNCMLPGTARDFEERELLSTREREIPLGRKFFSSGPMSRIGRSN